ncbi:MAG: ATP-binding protein [Acetivibrionales bacterium]|jgi:signal transduction histidine kinase
MRDLSLHLMDILQNSISAGADTVLIRIEADKSADQLLIIIDDNGTGIDRCLLDKVTDPFMTSRTTRKIGLGIPLFKASANKAGGELEIESVKGKGTTIKAVFKISHIDRLPLGDLAETVVTLIGGRPDIRFKIELYNMKENFRIDTLEIEDRLQDVPISNYEVLMWIKEYINEGVKIIFGGVLDEILS